MKEMKIVYNNISNMYYVVDMDDNSCGHIARGRTRSEAMRNGLLRQKTCEQLSQEPMEDIIIYFDI